MSEDLKEKLYMALTGAMTGLANGFFGGGGGMLVVPMLVFFLKMPPKKAHATAILIILPLTVVSGIIYSVYGNFDLAVGLPAGLGVVAGGVAGALLLKRIRNKWLSRIFAVIILIAGVKLLFF